MSWLFNAPTLIFLLGGLGVTIKLALCAIATAFVLGILLALARIGKNPWLRWPATIYIEGMRALPMLLVIVFVYFAVPHSLGIKFSPFTAGVIAMSLFSASLVAEIVRAGILAVPTGIVEAAESQGLRGSTIMQKIVLPIALRNMMPALVAQFVSLLKDTSLTAVITIPELLGRAQIVYAAPPFKPLPVFALVAAMYFVVNYTIGKAGQRLETRA
ncbi:MAG: amino acid ABC transporter permease [Vulcanimicrobiaceae bacterium]|jgi:putative glutamine transport system permease protein